MSNYATDTHHLMPGVRSVDLQNPDWTRTLHDRQLTGFSPLNLGMYEKPAIWATIDVGGEVGDTVLVTCSRGGVELLVHDGAWQLVGMDGMKRWRSGVAGKPVFFGNLSCDSNDRILFAGGPTLTLVDAETGSTLWTYTDPEEHVEMRVDIADILSDLPGMAAAVFPQYSGEGGVVHFPPGADPEFLWWGPVVDEDEWPERADHGCSARFDTSVPDHPLVWNVRHHRCRGFDAVTGRRISEIIYEIGGAQRRNYGPWQLGQDSAGQPLITIVGEMVQSHVHAIILNRHGPSELAWQHYYGEVYVVPGVAVRAVAMRDIDCDNATELLYNTRDPDQGYRSFVRSRNAATGNVEIELPDTWCAGWVSLGTPDQPTLLTYAAPNGAMPQRGNLTAHRIEPNGELQEIGCLPGAHLWGPTTADSGLFVRQFTDDGPVLVRFELVGGVLQPTETTAADLLVASPVRQVVEVGGEPAFIVSYQSTLAAVR